MTTILKEAKIAIDNSKLYVEIDRANSTLLYQWKGHILDGEARSGFTQIIELIKANNVKNLIADLFRFKGGTVETAKWVNENYSRMLKEAGIKKVATTIPESAFGEFSNRIALGDKTVTLLEVEKFTSAHDACQWFSASTVEC